MRPNLFLVGAPRCGTTTLHHYLAQHPDVFMSTPKEPHYFCGDIHREFDEHQGGTTDPLFREERQYLRLFEAAGDARVRGESSVYYLYSPEAARRIAAFAHDARVVILVREPVEFMCSLHAKLRWAGDEDQTSFAAAYDLEGARRRGEHVPSTVRFPSILFYSRYARFSRWIDLYREVFGDERVLLLLLDDLQADPEAVYHRVLDHVGVARAALPAAAPSNPNMEPRWRFVTRYLRRRGRRRGGRVQRVLERWNTRVAPRRPLDDATRSRIMRDLVPEVRELSQRVGRDLSAAWGYDRIDGR